MFQSGFCFILIKESNNETIFVFFVWQFSSSRYHVNEQPLTQSIRQLLLELVVIVVYAALCTFYLAYRTGQAVDLTVIGNSVFTLSRDFSLPYHVINRTKGLNGVYLLFRHLQYL